MDLEQSRLLFGADPMPRIVAVALGETGTVKVYRRESNGTTTCDTEAFHPFLWLDSDITDLGLENIQRLEGDLGYGWRISVDSWKELIALRNGLKKAGRRFFGLSDPVQQYLTSSGRTLFKDLPFEELRRLQIEVLVRSDSSTTGESGRDGHIMSIALADNSGWEELILVDPGNIEESERNALKRLTHLIKERDPDVIEGHDLFRTDLPNLVARSRKTKTKLDWGRGGGFLHSRPSRLQIAEKTIDYPKFTTEGRHFVDTFLLAQLYDVGMRTLSGFDRGDVAQHFGLAEAAEASTLAGVDLQRAYLDGSDNFRDRALGAVRETRSVAELLSPSYFIQAQIFPYNYQDVILRGNATRINALFLREYYRQNHSLPEMPMVRGFEGGYTAIFFSGIAHNVWHCDIASLYPSIMLQFDCLPATDRLQIFRHLLTDLRRFRLAAKAEMRAATDPGKHRHLHALQNTFKILINSFYGYLGFAQGHFADFDAAARVTETGRELLKKMINWLSAQGAQVIEVDTDGIYFIPPDQVEMDQLRSGLAAELPPGIEVEFDETFEAMFSYKAKNYALLTPQGEVIIKGGALKSRGLEKFQRVFLVEMIRLLMQGKPEAVSKLKTKFKREIFERTWPIDMLVKTDTLQDSLEKYRQKIANSARNRAAAYELALASGRNYRAGDQVSYYVTGSSRKVAAYENAKLASSFDPQNRDENVDYYIAKLDDLTKKFAAFTPDAEQKDLEL